LAIHFVKLKKKDHFVIEFLVLCSALLPCLPLCLSLRSAEDETDENETDGSLSSFRTSLFQQ